MESILKLTIVHEDSQSVTARLDGDLNQTSKESLRQYCHNYQIEKDKMIILDLTGLKFIDKFGVDTLAELKTQGVKTINGSVFIKMMIDAPDTHE